MRSFVIVAVAVVCAVTVVVVPTAPSVAGPHGGKAGRIVRVERPRTGARGTPRICQLTDVKAGQCYGKGPIEGETAWLIDNTRNRGQVRVGKVQPSTPNCATPQYWSFDVDTLDADIKDIEPYRTYLVLDIDTGSAGHVVDTSRLTAPDGQSPWLAMDRGRGLGGYGDDAADVMVTAYSCDANGAKIVNGGYGGNGYCLEYYLLSGGHWDMARRDVVTNCQP